MKCHTCNQESSRIRIINGWDVCSHCGGFSEANGVRLDGILSRQRVSSEAYKWEGDTLNPFMYNKISRRTEPNPEFIRRHAHNARNVYTEKDLKEYPGLTKKMNRESQERTEHIGDTDQAIIQTVSNLNG